MHRFSLHLSQIGKINIGSGSCRQFFLRLLRCLPDPLHSRKVLRYIHLFLSPEVAHNPVYNPAVKIIASQVVVSRCGQNFNYAFPDLDNRNIKSAASQVVHHNLLRFSVIQTIGHSRAGRFINDPLYIEACNPPRILCSLALDVVKISRNRDHRIGYRLP